MASGAPTKAGMPEIATRMNGFDTGAANLRRRCCVRPTHIKSPLLPATLESEKVKGTKGAAAMKNQAIQYLALDVHQSTVVATLRDGEGNIIMRATVGTNAKAILALVGSAGPRVHVAFEEGTQAQWLHDLIAPHAERVIVCNTRGREG